MVNKRDPLESKISGLFERVCRIFKILQWEIAKKYKFSPIQFLFLLYLKEYPKKFSTVLNLSKEFGLTVPTVSDSIKTLIKKGLIIKEKNPEDKRNHYLILTEEGKEMVKKLKNWDKNFQNSLKSLSQEEKYQLQELLLKMILNFQAKGIPFQIHACMTCKNFKITKDNGKEEYYCMLTKTKMDSSKIKFKCYTYKEKV